MEYGDGDDPRASPIDNGTCAPHRLVHESPDRQCQLGRVSPSTAPNMRSCFCSVAVRLRRRGRGPFPRRCTILGKPNPIRISRCWSRPWSKPRTAAVVPHTRASWRL